MKRKKRRDSLGAQELREWRAEHRLTQTEAAALFGVDMTKLSKFETGAGKPGRSASVRIQHGTKGRVKVEYWDLPARPVPVAASGEAA